MCVIKLNAGINTRLHLHLGELSKTSCTRRKVLHKTSILLCPLPFWPVVPWAGCQACRVLHA